MNAPNETRLCEKTLNNNTQVGAIAIADLARAPSLRARAEELVLLVMVLFPRDLAVCVPRSAKHQSTAQVKSTLGPKGMDKILQSVSSQDNKIEARRGVGSETREEQEKEPR